MPQGAENLDGAWDSTKLGRLGIQVCLAHTRCTTYVQHNQTRRICIGSSTQYDPCAPPPPHTKKDAITSSQNLQDIDKKPFDVIPPPLPLPWVTCHSGLKRVPTQPRPKGLQMRFVPWRLASMTKKTFLAAAIVKVSHKLRQILNAFFCFRLSTCATSTRQLRVP